MTDERHRDPGEPLSQELPTSGIPARFAYIGLDGDPQVMPIGVGRRGASSTPLKPETPRRRTNLRVADPRDRLPQYSSSLLNRNL